MATADRQRQVDRIGYPRASIVSLFSAISHKCLTGEAKHSDKRSLKHCIYLYYSVANCSGSRCVQALTWLLRADRGRRQRYATGTKAKGRRKTPDFSGFFITDTQPPTGASLCFQCSTRARGGSAPQLGSSRHAAGISRSAWRACCAAQITHAQGSCFRTSFLHTLDVQSMEPLPLLHPCYVSKSASVTVEIGVFSTRSPCPATLLPRSYALCARTHAHAPTTAAAVTGCASSKFGGRKVQARIAALGRQVFVFQLPDAHRPRWLRTYSLD